MWMCHIPLCEICAVFVRLLCPFSEALIAQECTSTKSNEGRVGLTVRLMLGILLGLSLKIHRLSTHPLWETVTCPRNTLKCKEDS